MENKSYGKFINGTNIYITGKNYINLKFLTKL